MKGKDRKLGFELKAINNMILRKVYTRFARAGLEDICGMQGPVLGYLDCHTTRRDVFQRDIEQHFNIRRSTATGMLQNLEQKGYLVREPVPQDARLKRIVLTEKARNVNRQVQGIIDAFHEELEFGITPEEKEIFLRVADKIMDNLSEERKNGDDKTDTETGKRV